MDYKPGGVKDEKVPGTRHKKVPGTLKCPVPGTLQPPVDKLKSLLACLQADKKIEYTHQKHLKGGHKNDF